MDNCEESCNTSSRINPPASWSFEQKQRMARRVATMRREPCHFEDGGEIYIEQPPSVLIELDDRVLRPYEVPGWSNPAMDE